MVDNTDINASVMDKDADETVQNAAREIEKLRADIDAIDDDIIRLLARRFDATRQVGQWKSQAGFAALDSAREERQRERLRTVAQESGLEESIAVGYLEFVVGESKKRHKKIAEGK